jgi:hypothetical protein
MPSASTIAAFFGESSHGRIAARIGIRRSMNS